MDAAFESAVDDIARLRNSVDDLIRLTEADAFLSNREPANDLTTVLEALADSVERTAQRIGALTTANQHLAAAVAEGKRREDALHERERESRVIVESIPGLVALLSATGAVEVVNRQVFEYFGQTLESLKRWDTSDAVQPGDLPHVIQIFTESLSSGRPEVNTTIEDRKRAEPALRRRGALLLEGPRLARIGNFTWRVDTDEILWSEQVYRMFEIEPGTRVTLERIGGRVHPEDLSTLDDMVERARRGVSDFEYEHRLLMPDCSIRHLHLTAHGARDVHGRMEYIGAVQDVTQRRLAEEALDRARSELAHVSRATTLSEFTASIAHEVSQPLSGIITNAGTCLRMLDATPPEIDGARETARRTLRDGNRASDVISRLRALFSKREFTPEPLDLNDAAREVIALSSSDLQKHRVMLQSELADNLPVVAGDRIQLQQVVLNLLRNASDAMRDVDNRPRKLVIKTERELGDRIRLSVRDAGLGVDPANVGKLFDPFYTTKADGMGIGLAVSRSIVERHRGRLWAERNDPDPGATFAFSIPCVSGSPLDTAVRRSS